MARAVSMSTRLKISAGLKGNKNAFRGGPKAKLSTRDKIANINASNKAHLTPDQRARRSSVAKRLRAQARKEESIGKANPTPLAGVANKTPAMVRDTKRGRGEIPKFTDEKPITKPTTMAAAPTKVQPARQMSDAEKWHADANARSAKADAKLAAAREKRARGAIQTDASGRVVQRAGSTSSSQQTEAAKARLAQSPASKTSTGLKPTERGLASPDYIAALDRGAPAGKVGPGRQIKKATGADGELTAGQEAAKKATFKPGRTDNKQPAANANAKATSNASKTSAATRSSLEAQQHALNADRKNRVSELGKQLEKSTQMLGVAKDMLNRGQVDYATVKSAEANQKKFADLLAQARSPHPTPKSGPATGKAPASKKVSGSSRTVRRDAKMADLIREFKVKEV